MEDRGRRLELVSSRCRHFGTNQHRSEETRSLIEKCISRIEGATMCSRFKHNSKTSPRCQFVPSRTLSRPHGGPLIFPYPILKALKPRGSRVRGVADSGSSETPSPTSESIVERVTQFMNAFWKFLRPHTIRGTVLGSISVTARALIENPAAINWTLLPRALIGVLALLCGNGFIVGINQIYDVKIDKVSPSIK